MGIFILIMWIMKQLFQPSALYCTGQKNSKNMNIMTQKYTSISRVT